ncbi:probable RNA-binding protein 19 [Spea bombifrons]|uniref:probable RNA-binding protein 19 n=1 Tax=Spea bombifrons TaxID=233779 RepID=UPI002349E479|nr:probable RNA-binding protein 19 [Spea bombifrons]
MSRLIVKNLPNGIKEDRFRELFSAFGTLTDCSLKYTKDGKFRKFGFVGFGSEDEAKAALSHFQKSYIDTSRVTVELCKSFGDPAKPKAWSKYSQKEVKDTKGQESKNTKSTDTKAPKKKKNSELEELEKDSGFKEFLSVHQSRNKTATWTNDSQDININTVKSKSKDDYLNFDSESEQDLTEDEDGSEEDAPESTKDTVEKLALQSEISDMDYLKSKVVKESNVASSGEEEEGEEEETVPKGPEEAAEQEMSVGKVKEKSRPAKKEKPAVENEPTTPYTVKLRGAPFNVVEQNVKEFLAPLKPAAIRIVRNTHGNKTGYVFVDFSSEEEVQKALKKNKDYMGGRYIEVFRDERPERPQLPAKVQNRPWEQKAKDAEEQEDVSESGRLFVRNLPYSCTEDDLEKLFSKYGPISEIHFPIDRLTKKPKGFAFVTFLITEHAVKAYAEVDGQIFQGRMLHVLPSTAKKEDEGEAGADPSAYKKQKALKDKANSASSHNWNTLFMGTSAVADVIAQKYNTSKSQVLDHEGKGSMAVRVALGETQLVQDMRKFLIENGVSLDSFSQAAGTRSKTVILVKNLPASTQVAELQEVFGRFGDLGRVLLPEGGITAIVEFLEPTEAKRAFTKLAYSKFQHVPLYLEWAPMNVFSSPPAQKRVEAAEEAESEKTETEAVESQPQENQKSKEDEEEDDEEEEEETLPGCTLFIKNLNFSTNEEALQQAFSKVGTVKSCSISRKKDKSGSLLSMGFGFVEYRKPEQAQKALRQLQHLTLDGHQLEVKLSERATRPGTTTERKKQISKKQQSSKILVRNVPFQASVREIRELFSTFGELKTVRLPRKMAGTGNHRGFGFVDFVTKQDAKRAFSALCHSTHLYGRRLVLEWAEAEESVETLRRKTAEQYHGSPKKKRKVAEVMEDFMESLEPDDPDE